MPRHPVIALIALAFGSVAFMAGAIALAWSAIRWFYPELAPQVLATVVAYLPPATAETIEHVAMQPVQSRQMPMVPVLGLVALFMGMGCLAAGRRNLRPVDMSSDGRARIRISNPPPRPGRALEGAITMTREAALDQVYSLDLQCARAATSPDERPAAPVFQHKLDARPSRGAQGSSIPFRFDIPASAPATGSGLFDSRYRWNLTVQPVMAGFAPTSTFDVLFAPAPGTASALAWLAADADASIALIQAKLKETLKRDLTPEQRAQLRRMPPRMLALVAHVIWNPVRFVYAVGGAYIVLFEVLPFIADLLSSALHRF